jgi:pimeloyl-ACP methyl ester carboxylesterase
VPEPSCRPVYAAEEKEEPTPRVKVSNIELYYECVGEGVPVVLVTGYGADLFAWALQAPELSQSYRVYMIDNRGVGSTDKPDGPYTIKMMADEIKKIKVPTMVLVGRDDILTPPKFSEEIVNRIPGGFLNVIEGGHAYNQEVPSVFNGAVLEFFEKHRKA